MVGFPKHCNTKEDHLYVREHFPREQWEPVFQGLLDECMAWLSVGKLISKADGKTDSTHKVVTIGEEDGAPQHYQVEYKEDKNCKLFKVGFTPEEVEGIVKLTATESAVKATGNGGLDYDYSM